VRRGDFETGAEKYQYRDRLQSAVIECNESGQVISYEEYYPYGASAYRASKSGVDLSLKRYRFTGKERDEETGLDYFGVRYYASWLGRWTSGDPGGFVDGLNLYRYARNNPVNGVDAEGYSTEPPEENLPTDNSFKVDSQPLINIKNTSFSLEFDGIGFFDIEDASANVLKNTVTYSWSVLEGDKQDTGGNIINADRVRLEVLRISLNGYKDIVKGANKQFGNIFKKREFTGTDEQWAKLRGIKNEYKKLLVREELYEERAKAVDYIIYEWKLLAPDNFNLIDNVVNEAGEPVKMMLRVKDIIPSEASGEAVDIGGYNELPNFITGEDGIVRPSSSKFGENTIVVYLDSSTEDRAYYEKVTGKNTTTHEAGHFYIFVTQAKKYQAYVEKLKKEKRPINGGHNEDDISGKKAHEFEKIRFYR
jgi:RHS repeat-associated protein